MLLINQSPGEEYEKIVTASKKIAVALTGPRIDGQTVTGPGTRKPFSESWSERTNPEGLTSFSSAGPRVTESEPRGATVRGPRSRGQGCQFQAVSQGF